MRILVTDPLPEVGLQLMRDGGLTVDAKTDLTPETLLTTIGDYDGLIVRSRTKVTPAVLAAATNLKVIGRAGVGIDNIDLPAATRRGIVVMNTPGGSSVTVAEHAMALLLATIRHIPAATASIKAGKWEKKRFKGRELAGKTLGVVGMGNIGSNLIRRARAFGMNVIAYDPFISPEAAAALGAELVDVVTLLATADAVSLHVPLTDKTRHLINAESLATMKRGAYVINCARGGIVDEVALAEALESGQLAGAALDVFEVEPPAPDHPLLSVDTFVCSPHLGASTKEAQETVARQMAEQVLAFCTDGSIQNAVNVPSVSKDVLARLGPWLPLATKLGELAAQLAPDTLSEVAIEYSGAITQNPVEPLTNALLAGLLKHVSLEPVNAVNAASLAGERGLKTVVTKRATHPDYASLISFELRGEGSELDAAVTIYGKHDPRIVRLNGYDLDAAPEGHLLVMHNDDVPGVVGAVGAVLGGAGINIGRIHLSRVKHAGRAYSIVNIDSAAPDTVMQALQDLPHVLEIHQIEL